MEYWAFLIARNEGNSGSIDLQNNAYKSVRVIGDLYSLFYTVWCDNSHELYVSQLNDHLFTCFNSAAFRRT